MDEDERQNQSWSEHVICDLAQALRRDGLVKSAEMLDDVCIALAQEVQALDKARQAQMDAGRTALKLVVN